MLKLRNIDLEASIAELKSDIVRVNLQLQKISNLAGNDLEELRFRGGFNKQMADLEESIKILTSKNPEESIYELQLLLNEKMIEVETRVLKLISYPGDAIPSPNISRLSIWTKLMDRHLWTYCPDLVSHSPKISTIRSLPLTSEQIAPLQNLLWHHSVSCNVLPSAPDYLAVAADALGAKIGELHKIIEGQKLKLNTLKEIPDRDIEEETSVRDIKENLITAKKNVRLLTKRVSELGRVTTDVQKTLTKEKADHEIDLQFRKKCQKEWKKKVEDLEVESTTARGQISKLQNQLRLRETRDSKILTSDHTWEIRLMREKHQEEVAEMREKNRKIVAEVMQLQESNSSFMKALTSRDEKLKALRVKDQCYYNVVSIETEAMKKAFEIKLNSLQRELEEAKSETRRLAQR